MKVYRIAKKAFIEDLTGEGARRYGGRWNSKGVGLLYTSENRSLATVEYLVHLPFTLFPKDLCIAEIEVPDSLDSETVRISELPDNWKDYPAPFDLAKIGDRWKRKNETIALRVPSVVVKDEWNVLLNPDHRHFPQLTFSRIEDYFYDSRLLRAY